MKSITTKIFGLGLLLAVLACGGKTDKKAKETAEANIPESTLEIENPQLTFGFIKLSDMAPLAIAYENGRRWDLAVETWKKTIEVATQPTHVAEARSRIIGLYKRQNRLRQVIREFRERFEQTPPDLEAGYFLAEAYSKMSQPEEAVAVYRKIIQADGKVDKEDIDALTQLEKALTQRGENKEAIEILEQLAELRPLRAKEYYHRIAELSLKTYEDDKAVRFAKLALEKNPDDATAHARLGDVYAKMQRMEEALKEYRTAIDLDPRSFPNYFALAEILLDLGQREEAKELYRAVALKAFDDQMILVAARQAMALSRSYGELEFLEGELAPLVFRSPPKPVYRKVMLEMYGRMTVSMIAERNYGNIDKEEQERLKRVGTRAFPV